MEIDILNTEHSVAQGRLHLFPVHQWYRGLLEWEAAKTVEIHYLERMQMIDFIKLKLKYVL